MSRLNENRSIKVVKILRSFTGLLLSLTLFTSVILSQERDSLIQLYSGIGDTIDYIDKEIFGLYLNIDGYKYAQLFSRDKKYLVSKISYIKNERLSDTILVESLSRFYNMRFQLSQFIIDNDNKFESPPNASIFTDSDNIYNGKLEMFSKHFLFLNSDDDYLTGSSSPFRYKTPIAKVDSLTISFKRDVFPYVGYGALCGFALGIIGGIATFNDDMGADKEVKWVVTGGIGALVGGLLGWLIGESLPLDYINIKINSPNDVAKLKDYSAYYFQHDESVEKNYVELE